MFTNLTNLLGGNHSRMNNLADNVAKLIIMGRTADSRPHFRVFAQWSQINQHFPAPQDHFRGDFNRVGLSGLAAT